MTPCPFCAIVAGEAEATVVREWDDVLCIVPLNPVVDGHLLVLPKRHVQTVFSDPEVSAATMRRTAEMLHGVERHHEPRDHNVITSAGRAATQTVDHLHFHIVPRTHGDGLALPWTVSADSNGEPSLVVGKHAKRVPTTAYREAFFWTCNECGWLGSELFSLNSAMKEAGEHWKATHGTTGMEAPPIVERRDEDTR